MIVESQIQIDEISKADLKVAIQNDDETSTIDLDQSRESLLRKDLKNVMHPARSDVKRDDFVSRKATNSRRSFIQRNFTKMGSGSLRGSIFAMIASAIGSGVLTFPKVFDENGWILGIIMVIMGAVSCWWSLYMLVQRARHHNLYSYNEIAEKAGGPLLQRYLQICILVYIFANCLACTIVSKNYIWNESIIIVSEIVLILSGNIGMPQSFTGRVDGPVTFYKVLIPIVFLGLFVFPLSLRRDVSKLRYFALGSIIALTVTLLVVMFEMPFYVRQYHDTLSEEERKVVHSCPSFNFFNSAGIIFFAFTNHTSLLPVYNELDNPVKRRIMKVISRSTFMVSIFYICMAMFGYFSTLGRTPDIIIARESLPDMQTDFFMIFTKVALLLVMVVNQVTNYMPFRYNLFQMVYEHDDISKKQNVIMTGIFYAIICIISILLPNVISVLGIFGGLTSTSICYFIPCKLLFLLTFIVFCYIKLRNMGDPFTSFKNILAMAFFGVLIVFGFLSIIASFIKFYDPQSSLLQCH
ncbi:sodium-coupled neutral amino acid transporter 1 isoform 1 [Stylonychia lemnae]|uniref:Sodium-coupled neutral amino acid transporter 1 isoform 1 n=1 Tax=Stylonychia lemnae TaxID=5949 RepID=A0A078A0C2_STYLE|nr:sodium-coupled neutral amino acid transporter 1 isoform 1 [Stylonychia lemnae]|eukprot:CDW75595.1 sodium-coupled neutral amino acid transporter 1 isoform 1 [Stylonychia lemnae]